MRSLEYSAVARVRSAHGVVDPSRLRLEASRSAQGMPACHGKAVQRSLTYSPSSSEAGISLKTLLWVCSVQDPSFVGKEII